MNNPDKVKEVVAEAKSMAIEKYDWDLIANKVDQEIFDPLFK